MLLGWLGVFFSHCWLVCILSLVQDLNSVSNIPQFYAQNPSRCFKSQNVWLSSTLSSWNLQVIKIPTVPMVSLQKNRDRPRFSKHSDSIPPAPCWGFDNLFDVFCHPRYGNTHELATLVLQFSNRGLWKDPRAWGVLGIPNSWMVYFMENPKNEIALLRIIPTMTSIRFVTGKSSGILSGISFGILPGISSAICSGTLSGISYDILSGILSGKSSGKHSGTLSGIPSGILSDILSGISSGILSGKHSGTLSGISSGILSDILSGVLSGISSGNLSGRWGPAVLTELGESQVEVQRCSLSSEGPRLRSSGAHWGRTVPGWGPAVLTEYPCIHRPEAVSTMVMTALQSRTQKFRSIWWWQLCNPGPLQKWGLAFRVRFMYLFYLRSCELNPLQDA